MSKRLLKAVLQTVAPQTATAWFAARARAYSNRLFHEWGLTEIDRRLIREVGSEVLSGPFRGMTLSPTTYEEHIGPYLLGTYEFELHPWWEAMAGDRFPHIIDVGSKFGYYAVGMARRYPAAEVVAFDIGPWARVAMKEMCVANQTTNVKVASACTPRWLRRNLHPGALVFSDCEGYEGDLFASPTPSALDTATLIIETHDAFRPGVSERLRKRFAATHTRSEVSVSAEIPLPTTPDCSPTCDELVRAAREVREEQTWLRLRPHLALAG